MENDLIYLFYWLILLTEKIKWQSGLLAWTFALYLLFYMKFGKPYRTNIKILFALQQDIDTYFFSVLLHCFEKILKKINFVLYGHFKEGSLNFHFSMASMKLNYRDIFCFWSTFKVYDSNICTKLFIKEQKIINNCLSDTSNCLKSNFWKLKYYVVPREVIANACDGFYIHVSIHLKNYYSFKDMHTITNMGRTSFN